MLVGAKPVLAKELELYNNKLELVSKLGSSFEPEAAKTRLNYIFHILEAEQNYEAAEEAFIKKTIGGKTPKRLRAIKNNLIAQLKIATKIYHEMIDLKSAFHRETGYEIDPRNLRYKGFREARAELKRYVIDEGSYVALKKLVLAEGRLLHELNIPSGAGLARAFGLINKTDVPGAGMMGLYHAYDAPKHGLPKGGIINRFESREGFFFFGNLEMAEDFYDWRYNDGDPSKHRKILELKLSKYRFKRLRTTGVVVNHAAYFNGLEYLCFMVPVSMYEKFNREIMKGRIVVRQV